MTEYLDIAAELATAFPHVEDAYQIAALEICEQAVKRPDMPPAEFRPYAAKCARDRLKNAQSRQGYERRRGLSGGTELDFDRMPDERTADSDRLQRRLECLPDLLRRAAESKWIEELTWKEMAARFFPGEKQRNGVALAKDLVATARERIRADTAE